MLSVIKTLSLDCSPIFLCCSSEITASYTFCDELWTVNVSLTGFWSPECNILQYSVQTLHGMCHFSAKVLTVPEGTSPPLLCWSVFFWRILWAPPSVLSHFSFLHCKKKRKTKLQNHVLWSSITLIKNDRQCQNILQAAPCTIIFSACVYIKVSFFLSLELRDTELDRFFHSADTGNLLPVYPEKKVVSRLLLLNFVLHLGWKTTGTL